MIPKAPPTLESEKGLESEKVLGANDIAMTEGGAPVAGIVRFHNALRELVGRRGIRDDVSRYEAIGFGLVEMHGPERSGLLDSFPLEDSPLALGLLFDTLYGSLRRTICCQRARSFADYAPAGMGFRVTAIKRSKNGLRSENQRVVGTGSGNHAPPHSPLNALKTCLPHGHISARFRAQSYEKLRNGE